MDIQKAGSSLYLIFLLLYLMPIQLKCAWTFRSIDDYYFNIGIEEKLVDIHLIPNEEEVTVYLFKDEAQSYFYPLDVHDGPVSITVTPCTSAIEWKVYYQSPNTNYKSTSLEGDPLHLQERDNRRHSGQSTISTYFYTYYGKGMSTYKTNHEHLSDGTLRIVLLSKDDNTHVKILITNIHEEDPPFPQLPTNSDIDIIANDRSIVSVAWKPSPTHYLKGVRIKYCVAFNPRYNYQTLCALKEAMEGHSPPSWPKNAGFGFSWEVQWKQRLANLKKNKIAKIRRDIHFECVGGRQWATVNSLMPGRQYYVNVFAINEYTNRSVTYNQKTFITKPANDGSTNLYPGIVYTFNLGETHSLSDDNYRSFGFKLQDDVSKNVAIFVQGCQPQVITQVVYEGAIIVKDISLIDIQKIIFKHADAGNYTLRFKLDHLDQTLDKQVRVCVMYNSEKCAFNAAPTDYRLIIKHKNQSSNECNKSLLSLQWVSATNFNVKYCLFAQRLDQTADEYDYDTDYDEKEQCNRYPSSSPTVTRIFCRQYKRHNSNRRGKVIRETIPSEFEANRVYKFFLQGIFKNNVTIDYQPTKMLIYDQC